MAGGRVVGKAVQTQRRQLASRVCTVVAVVCEDAAVVAAVAAARSGSKVRLLGQDVEFWELANLQCHVSFCATQNLEENRKNGFKL